MPEEIIFDENIKGKVQVESLSELEDYVEHENVKRNATITKNYEDDWKDYNSFHNWPNFSMPFD